jgi:Amt family ammonium transporter
MALVGFNTAFAPMIFNHLIGWFSFNPWSALAFNASAMTVVITTFLAAASAMLSTLFFYYIDSKKNPDVLYAVNGILIGLIMITPLAGFVSPASSVVLGLLGGPLFVYGSKRFATHKRYSDLIDLFPGHLVSGIFGILMI